MKIILIFLIIFIIFTDCNINNDQSLTREERVKKIPYRFQVIEDYEKDSIKMDVIKIIQSYNSDFDINSNSLIGFKKTKDGNIIKFEQNWNSKKEMTEFLNKSWKNKDFIATGDISISQIKDLEKDTLKNSLVIELEYEKYTGTWRAFIELPLDKENIDKQLDLEYTERN